MRLKKFSLIAAAGLVAAAGLSAATATLTNSSGSTLALPPGYVFGGNINVPLNAGANNGITLTLDVAGNEASTYSGRIMGEVTTPTTAPFPIVTLGNSGTVVKTGAGTLQIDSYAKESNYYLGSFLSGAPPRALTDASQGALVIEEGVIRVSGYINQFVDFANISEFANVPNSEKFLGYSQTILKGSSVLSFEDTLLNVPGTLPTSDGTADGPSLHPGVARINYVVNLQAGTANSDANTRLVVGGSDDMHLIAHITSTPPGTLPPTGTAGQGSVGILEGKGEFIKSGIGTFTLLNRATFTGNITVVGGKLVVGNSANSVVANAIASAKGFNFAEGISNITDVGADYAGWSVGGSDSEYRPRYVPLQSATSLITDVTKSYESVLWLEGAQVINNLQYLFNTYSDVMPYRFASGGGSAISVLDNATIILNQQLNGGYTGDFLAHDASGNNLPVGATPVGGNFIKMGVATQDENGVYLTGALAIKGASTMVYRSMTVREGVLLSNVQSLGSGDVYVESGGILQIVQDDVGSLDAVLHGIGGTLRFTKDAQLMNNLSTILDSTGLPVGDSIPIHVGNGQIGSVDITRAQTDFFGTIFVTDGLQLRFSAANAFVNAASINLTSGANGEPTSLTFNDTNQIFKNFSGDAGTRVDLGQGNVTLWLDAGASTAYQGIFTGTGGLIKDGPGAFTLNGRDSAGNSKATYAGATVVKAGALVLGGPDTLPNTSGLVMAGGSIVLNGPQTFGALIGAAGSVVNIGGSDLTIGLTPARLAQIQSGVATSPLAPGNSFYLATTGDSVANTGVVTGYGADTTRAFLQSVGITDADVLAKLSFAGVITGSGGLIKQGTETLVLTGINTYTGATLVNGGTLQVNVGSIDASSSITIAAGAAFAINADAGVVATVTKPISGTGDFHKVGAGTLTLADSAIGYTGATYADGGTLRLALDKIAGALHVASGVTMVADQVNDLTFTKTVDGLGAFEKANIGRLTLTDFTGFAGNIVVSGGTLATSVIGSSVTDINVASGASYEATLSGTSTYNGTLNGAGTVSLIGGTTTFTQSSGTFTGTLAVTNGTIRAGTNNVAVTAAYDLTNATFDLNGTNQRIGAFSGDATSIVQLASGTLTFDTPADTLAEFSGTLRGAGNVVKNGEGTQRLSSYDTSVPWSGNTTVNAGVLESTVASLGNSLIQINLGGTLAFFNDIVGTTQAYGSAISGPGTLGKVGVGVVSLKDESVAFTGNILVSGGELLVDTVSGNFGAGGTPVGKVEAATGGIYGVSLRADLALDATDIAHRLTDASPIAGVDQHGSLAVSGNHTLTFVNGQSYTGNTILRSEKDPVTGLPAAGTAATLDLAGSTGVTEVSTGNLILNGLAGEIGTQVITGGTALTIVQNVAGTYEGSFDATTDITVRGAAKMIFTADTTGLGAMTVDGGRLQMDASAVNDVTLLNGGSLYFDTTISNAVYMGNVSGAGNMIKTGSGTLDLNGDLSRFANLTGAIGVDQGRLVVNVASLEAAPNVTGLLSEGLGELALEVTGGDTRSFSAGGMNVTGTGNVTKVGDGTLLLGDAANPYTLESKGLLTIEQGVLGGTFATSGDLHVATGGTLAPGNSPGTVTVNGNFLSNGTLALQLTAAGPYDRIIVNGSAIIDSGTVFNFSQDGPGTLSGKYTVLSATGGVQTTEGGFTLDPASRRVIIVTPERNADPRGLLYGRGAVNEINVYDVPSLDPSVFNGHEGLDGLLNTLAGFQVDQYGKPANAIGAALAFSTPTSALASAVNNLSPLGYASFYTMTRDAVSAQEDRIRERLEQRRYDAAGFANEEWEAFVVGSGAIANNPSKTDTATFDYHTYGGLVGFDKRLEDSSTLGLAAGYDSGSATLHGNGGKMDMSHVRGTAFYSTRILPKWFVEGGLGVGVGSYDAKRTLSLNSPLMGSTAVNTYRSTASSTGYDVGFNVNTGTIVTLTEDLHLTPHLGLSYLHQEISGFTEKGSAAALKVDGWSQDSLRFSLGTGLGWWLASGDWTWKLGMDVAYNHELLDTDSKINARFANLGGASFRTTAAALPEDSISVGPNVGVSFDETLSLSAGLNYEHGFDGRNYTNFNVTLRKRF